MELTPEKNFWMDTRSLFLNQYVSRGNGQDIEILIDTRAMDAFMSDVVAKRTGLHNYFTQDSRRRCLTANGLSIVTSSMESQPDLDVLPKR